MPVSEIIFVLMLLLAVGMLAAGLGARLPVPFTVLLVIIGIGLGELSRSWEAFAPLQAFQLTPELVLFVFLPTLIFESAFSLDARQLTKDIAPVLTLAIPALLISTALIGLGMWLLLPIEPIHALLFGALISATDPVAVIALFKELGTPKRLTILVEGESLMNDATAIVLFKILLGLALFGSFGWAEAGLAIAGFLEVFLGGALVGLVFGLAFGWLMTRMQANPAGVVVLSLVMAYLGFVVAEHFMHLSGVMAVAVAAVTLGVFAAPRLPHETGHAMHETWEFLALASNTLLFVLVGLAVDLGSLAARWYEIGIVILLVLAARAIVIYPLVPLATRLFRLPTVSVGERHIMWWGGLKGGLALAIVLSIPDDLPGRQVLLELTLGVVLFTLLINAPTIRPLIDRLGINRLTVDELAELGRASHLASHRARAVLDEFHRAGLLLSANHKRLEKQTGEELARELPNPGTAQIVRQERMRAIKLEMDELQRLYQAGVLQQYTYLDIRGELQRKRDHVAANTGGHGLRAHRQDKTLFLRLEDAVVRRLREHDWAAPLLTRYQNLRLSQHLKRAIARVLMGEVALDTLTASEALNDKQRAELTSTYRKRLAFFRSSLADANRDFPDYYQRFESRMAHRAALMGALHEVREETQAGGIGAKACTEMCRQIRAALDAIPPITTPVAEFNAPELIPLVPLFADLSQEAVAAVAGQARTVTFLAGDTVIGQGESGDALYIVAQGQVQVSHRNDEGIEHHVADLGIGDFFGETALFGDSRRTATVTARQAASLFRITRKAVMEIADRHAEVRQRLESALAERELPT